MEEKSLGFPVLHFRQNQRTHDPDHNQVGQELRDNAEKDAHKEHG